MIFSILFSLHLIGTLLFRRQLTFYVLTSEYFLSSAPSLFKGEGWDGGITFILTIRLILGVYPHPSPPPNGGGNFIDIHVFI